MPSKGKPKEKLMKKYFLTVLIAVMVVTGFFIGCDHPANSNNTENPGNTDNSDNDDSNKEFYGTWYCSWKEGDKDYSRTLTLNSDNSFLMIEQDPTRYEKHLSEYIGIENDNFYSSGSYTLTDNNGLTELNLNTEDFYYIDTHNTHINIGELKNVICTVAVSENTLTVTIEGTEEVLIFTKC